jgi:hypothetical protein
VDRPFLDANILFSAAYHPGSSLRQLWSLADTELLSCPFAAREAHDSLAQVRPVQLTDLAALLAGITMIPDPLAGSPLPAGIALPEKDKPIFLAAMAGRATHLLTGDKKHFGIYFGQNIAGILILRPAVYLQNRQSSP